MSVHPVGSVRIAAAAADDDACSLSWASIPSEPASPQKQSVGVSYTKYQPHHQYRDPGMPCTGTDREPNLACPESLVSTAARK